jgi:hypothetical protein
MLVSRTRFLARVKTCETCQYFKPSTGSCGTLILGDTVTHNGEPYKLCGCKIKAKAWLAFASCPLDKWQQKDRIVAILKEVKQFSKPPTQEEINRFYERKSELVGRSVSPECEACAREEIRNFIKDINNYLEEGNL